MNRRYLYLLAGIAAAAVLLSALGRMPRPRAETPAPAVARPLARLEIAFDGGGVTPALARVDKGAEVELIAENRGAARAALALSGYEDRVTAQIDAGARDTLRFIADRPGDGFVWTIDGRQVGRFVVAGSHLEEGHR